jgi:hypothetical protein
VQVLDLRGRHRCQARSEVIFDVAIVAKVLLQLALQVINAI